MASASAVPETYELEGGEAKETLKRTGWGRLLKDSFVRFRAADGFTNSRSIGQAAILTVIPGLIAVVGIASALHVHEIQQVIRQTIDRLAPGQSGRLLQQAFHQGSKGGVAVIGGLTAMLISGMFAMAVVERGLNREYGMIRDRSIGKKLAVALGLNVSAGVLFALAFALLAAGAGVSAGLGKAGVSDTLTTIFNVVRWPLGLLCAFGALTLVYKVSPNRNQPGAGWLQVGTVMATLLWVALTALLAWYYSVNDSLGQTYGPLVGIIALLTWAYASAVAVLFGAAFAAQLEAVRAGVPGPRTLRRFNETVVDPEETRHLEYERPAMAPSVATPVAQPTVPVAPVAPAAEDPTDARRISA